MVEPVAPPTALEELAVCIYVMEGVAKGAEGNTALIADNRAGKPPIAGKPKVSVDQRLFATM